MDWSKYSALKSGSKASIAEGVKKEAVKYESGDPGLRDAVAEVKYKDGDDIPEGKKAGDVKVAAVSAIKVGDVKEAEQKAIYLSQKRWDADSGEALDDNKMELSLPALEAEKGRYDAQIADLKAKSDGLAAVIEDYKAA